MATERLQGEENFILRTTFRKWLIPMPNAFEKSTTKTELCNGKSYIKKDTIDCSCKCSCTFPHSYAELRKVTQSRFQ